MGILSIVALLAVLIVIHSQLLVEGDRPDAATFGEAGV